MPVSLHSLTGAQVLQAQLASEEVFYLSPIFLTPPIRGGVPVMFPQFNDVGPLVKHGMVRTLPWVLLQDERLQATDNDARLKFGLTLQLGDHPSWPHAAQLTLTVMATARKLEFTLDVVNIGFDTFYWTGGLHPYFALQDLLGSQLTGLSGLAVKDKFDADLRIQPFGDLTWSDQPFERLFEGSTNLVLRDGTRSLRLSAAGFDQWMVWNPGRTGGSALKDLPEGDWKRFVCIEPVCVSRPVKMEPAETFQGRLFIEHTD